MIATEADRDGELELRRYVDVLRRRWITVVLTVGILTAVAVGAALLQDDQYRVTAELLIEQSSTETILVSDADVGAFVAGQNAARRLNNEVASINAGVTRREVEAHYEGQLDVDSVTASISAAASDTVTVTMTATDADEAARLVNLYVSTFIDLRRQLRIDGLRAAATETEAQLDDVNGRIADIRRPLVEVEARVDADPGNVDLVARRDELALQVAAEVEPLESQRAFYQQTLEDLRVSASTAQTTGARVLTDAEPDDTPVAPNRARSGVLALILGLLIGTGVAFLRDHLDERIRSLEDLERAAPGMPLLGLVPEASSRNAPSFIAVRDDSHSPSAEAFRSLRTSAKFLSLDRDLKVLQITSSVPGEGTATVAANLALAFTQAGERVALVCCDLRRPSVHLRFSQDAVPGLTDVVLGEVPLGDAIRDLGDGLYFLPSGSVPPNPSELLSSALAASVLEQIADGVDFVIVDSTPVLPVADALVISRVVDATLVVVDTRSTKRKVLRQALVQLEQVSAPVVGLVLNGIDATGSRGYGYGYEVAQGAEA